MKLSVALLNLLPEESFYITDEENGRLIAEWRCLSLETVVNVHFRLRGGKGGFGSLLRSFGSQFYKSTNQDACRDLTGRRIRDVNEEERLKKWIAKAAEREREKQARKLERLERLRRTPKHEFSDADYVKAKQQIIESTEEAIEEGIQAVYRLRERMTESETTAGRDSKDVVQPSSSEETRKRKIDSNGAGASATARQIPLKKSKGLWLGIDEIETSDSSSDSDDTVSLSDCLNTITKEESTPVPPSGANKVISERPKTDIEQHPNKVDDQTREIGQEAAQKEVPLTAHLPEINIEKEETLETELPQTVEKEGECNRDGSKLSITTPMGTSDEITGSIEETPVVDKSSLSEKISTEASKTISYQSIDLNDFKSASELMSLGLDHLKAELQCRGLKCGGSQEERAARLWAVRGLAEQQYPPSLVAKKK